MTPPASPPRPTVPDILPSRPPRPTHATRRRWILLGAGIVAVVIAAVAILLTTGQPTHPGIAADRPVTGSAAQQIDRLLQRRAHAMVDRDAAEFRATLDPAAGGFRQSQLAGFRNAARVRFASWRYDWSPRAHAPLPAGLRPHLIGARRVLPAEIVEHYRIAGFDRRPTAVPQSAVFVEWGNRWSIASVVAGHVDGRPQPVDPWALGPVRVVRTPQALVLGPPSKLTTMHQVAALSDAAVQRVTAVWGTGWSRRAVFEVPATQHQLALEAGVRGNLAPIAALTSAEVHESGRPDPVGDRVVLNPRNWPRLSPAGRLIVLSHELTHVASRPDTGSAMPTWLSEGLAEYVGFRDSGVSIRLAAAALARRIAADGLPSRLPADADFGTGSWLLTVAYQEGWLACLAIADSWGTDSLVRFYRAVGTSDASSARAVELALHRVLHIDRTGLLQRWRAELSSQLG